MRLGVGWWCGPLRGELAGGKVVVGGVGPVPVVIDALVLDHHPTFEQAVEMTSVGNSSRNLPLNDSIHAF
jgi:hypothetical protein